MQSAAATRNLDAAIPLQSAEAELQNAIELRTTATQIVAPKPDLERPSRKTTILKHFLKGILKGNSSAPKWRIICCQSTIRKFHPASTIQLVTFNCETQKYYAPAVVRNLDAAIPLRSAQTELHNTIDIATHYCRTHRFDAPVPMHKVSQHMQNTIAQRQQRREKVTWNLQFHCARKSNRNRRQSEDRRTRRASEPTFLRNGISGYPKKTQCFVQILTFKSHPWCNSSNAICQEWFAKHN